MAQAMMPKEKHGPYWAGYVSYAHHLMEWLEEKKPNEL